MEELGESGRGEHGYGSTRVSANKSSPNQDIKTQFSDAGQSSDAKQKKRETTMNQFRESPIYPSYRG